MKKLTFLLTLTLMVLSSSALGGPSGGGGYDFKEDPTKTMDTKYIKEIVEGATAVEPCDINLIVRAVTLQMFDHTRAGQVLAAQTLPEEEMKCWKLALARMDELRKALGTAFVPELPEKK
jgi:hypothetical protein